MELSSDNRAVAPARSRHLLTLSLCSDPYACVRVGAQEYFTRCIGSECDPVFNERFSFLAPVAQGLTQCAVTFYDKERWVCSHVCVSWLMQ